MSISSKWVLKEFKVHDPQTPYLSSSLQKLWDWAPWKGRRGDPRGLWDWEIEEESFWGWWWRVQKRKRMWKKENERKEMDLCTVVWLQANWVLFVMCSRWGPTSATQWQPPTSTTMGEWTGWRWDRWWQKNGERETKWVKWQEKGETCKLKQETKNEGWGHRNNVWLFGRSPCVSSVTLSLSNVSWECLKILCTLTLSEVSLSVKCSVGQFHFPKPGRGTTLKRKCVSVQ